MCGGGAVGGGGGTVNLATAVLGRPKEISVGGGGGVGVGQRVADIDRRRRLVPPPPTPTPPPRHRSTPPTAGAVASATIQSNAATTNYRRLMAPFRRPHRVVRHDDVDAVLAAGARRHYY